MSNIRRIRNILAENNTGKTRISSGYKKEFIERKEGDIWEEKGKTWTIKNGVERTVNKLSKLREIATIPLACKCGHPLKHHLDKNAWNMTGECYTCLLKKETKHRLNGTFEDYIKEKRKANTKSWMGDAEIEFKEELEALNKKQYITEFGDIEDWNGNINKEKIKERQKQELEKAQGVIDDAGKN